MDKSTMITLGVANGSEKTFKIDEVKLWEFKKCRILATQLYSNMRIHFIQ